MKALDCPLCRCSDAKVIEKINTADIQAAYMRVYGVSTDFQTSEVNYASCANCHLKFFEPMTAGGEHLYEQLQEFEWYYMTDKPEYGLAEAYLPEHGAILEVGSGKAAFAGVVGKERYVGLEFNDEAIRSANLAGVRLVKESVEIHAKRNAGRYAAVISFQVLEHVANPADFIQACVNALQVGGTLIFAVPNHEGICGMAQNSILDLPPHHMTHWSHRTFEHVAKQYNLRLQSIDFEPVAGFHVTWARRSIYEARIRRILHLKSTLLDRSFLSRLISRFAGILARVYAPNLATLNGHSILARFQKIG